MFIVLFEESKAKTLRRLCMHVFISMFTIFEMFTSTFNCSRTALEFWEMTVRPPPINYLAPELWLQ